MGYYLEAPDLPERTFSVLRELIHERLGLYYEDERREMLRDRLAPLVMERNLHSFMDYYYLLKYDPTADEEWLRVQTALAVRETYFWREYDQVRAVAEILIPKRLAENSRSPTRVWHAACASGEEPYSLVISLMEHNICQLDQIEILGTDFDLTALQAAQQGLYGDRSFRAIPPEIRRKYFRPAQDGRMELDSAVRQRVKFSYLNLADHGSMQLMQGWDIIFCRNVFIYFSDTVIERVANHFYHALNPGGVLCLGAVESLLRVKTPFELVEIGNTFMYQKT